MENDQLRAMVGEVVREVVREEIAPLESRVGALARTVELQGRLIDDHSKALATVANAAAAAADMAAKAMQAVDESRDANAKMITSALEGHKKAVSDTIADAMRAHRQSLVDNVERAAGAAVEKQVQAAVAPIDARTQNMARELGVPDDPTPNGGEALTPGGIIKTQHRVAIVLAVQVVVALGYVAKLILDALPH